MIFAVLERLEGLDPMPASCAEELLSLTGLSVTGARHHEARPTTDARHVAPSLSEVKSLACDRRGDRPRWKMSIIGHVPEAAIQSLRPVRLAGTASSDTRRHPPCAPPLLLR